MFVKLAGKLREMGFRLAIGPSMTRVLVILAALFGSLAGPVLAQGAPEVPRFAEDTPYRSVRTALTRDGWRPVTIAGAERCTDSRCAGFPEVIICFGVGRALCEYSWQKNDAYLLVNAWGEGNQKFDSLELCSRITLGREFGTQCAAYVPTRGAALPTVGFSVPECVTRLTSEVDRPHRLSPARARAECGAIEIEIGMSADAIVGIWQRRSDDGHVETIDFRPGGIAHTRLFSFRTRRIEDETRQWAFSAPDTLEFYSYLVSVEFSGNTMRVGHKPASSEWVEEWTRVSPARASSDAPSSRPAETQSVLTRPVAGDGVNSPFFDPEYPASQSRQHLGVDLTAPRETEVVSPIDGTVQYNFTDRAADSAFMIIRDSVTGTDHVLGHLGSDRPAGSQVRRGQPIGRVKFLWAEGRDQSHLHWGINTQHISPSTVEGPGGPWGWGKAPITATRSQAADRGWVDPLTMLVGVDQTSFAPVPSALNVLPLTAENSVDVWTTSVYPNGSRDRRPGGLDNAELRVGGWGDTYVSLLRFPTAPAEARRVILELYNAANEGSPTDMVVRPLRAPWAVRSDGRFAWAALPPLAEQRQTVSVAGSGQWIQIDITEINQEWASGRLANNGIALFPVTTNNNFNEFVSVNSGRQNLRPRITWSVGDPSSGLNGEPLGGTEPTSLEWRPVPQFRETLSAGESAGLWSFRIDGRLMRGGVLVARVPGGNACDIYSLAPFVIVTCRDQDGGGNSPHVLLRDGAVVNDNLLRLSTPASRSRRCDGANCYLLQPDYVGGFLLSGDGRYLAANAGIGSVSSGIVFWNVETGSNIFVLSPHEFAPNPDWYDGMGGRADHLDSFLVRLEPLGNNQVRIQWSIYCGGPIEPEQLARCVPKLRRQVQPFADVTVTTGPESATACCFSSIVDLETMTYDFPALRQARWAVPDRRP